jgi:hypothetical protein
MTLLGLAEVTDHKMLQVDGVLHRQRFVETVVRAECRNGRRIRDRALSEVGRGRIAGHQLGEDESHKGDAEAEQDERRKAPP